MRNQYLTRNSGQTKKLGKILAKEILQTESSGKAFIIGLEGELGGGKTTFLQGFAEGLGIQEKILSPTFVILKKFPIRANSCLPHRESKTLLWGSNPPLTNRLVGGECKFATFYHIDCYRIKDEKEILALGFQKIISEPKNIIAIEWADRIKKIIPKNAFWLKFEFLDEKMRKITVENF